MFTSINGRVRGGQQIGLFHMSKTEVQNIISENQKQLKMVDGCKFCLAKLHVGSVGIIHSTNLQCLLNVGVLGNPWFKI